VSEIEADQLAALAAAIRDALASAPPSPEGLNAAAAAHFCGVSRSAWFELDRRTLCPAAVTVGDSKRVWLRSELSAWLRAGAPSRIHWRGMRTQALRGVA
jgi:predicted DNA-binding transcriptional regulator AlpA